MEGRVRAAEAARDLALYTAWHFAAFDRTKTLPKLNKLLARRSAAMTQTPEQIMHAMQAWARATRH